MNPLALAIGHWPLHAVSYYIWTILCYGRNWKPTLNYLVGIDAVFSSPIIMQKRKGLPAVLLYYNLF